MIVFENVHKTYKKSDHVFQDLSVSILPGEFVVITGAPGAGKTTFLKMIFFHIKSKVNGDSSLQKVK
jgi:ABC-type ATPase involved in cell division